MNTSNSRLSNKVAIVTGGSSGIGRASALAFAREGAKVAVVDITVAGGEETVALIKKAGGEAMFMKADVSQAAQVEAMVHRVVSTYGRLDCAHNNAGGTGNRFFTHEYSEKDWDDVINVNLKGVWLCLKYEIPQMLKGGGGAIVNTSSTAGLLGFRKGAAYAASKHGVLGLTKAAAIEYASKGIRVNAICPGLVRTPPILKQMGTDPKNIERFTTFAPINRLGNPEEIAEAVVWLCSDAASFVTGHALVADGGLVIS